MVGVGWPRVVCCARVLSRCLRVAASYSPQRALRTCPPHKLPSPCLTQERTRPTAHHLTPLYPLFSYTQRVCATHVCCSHVGCVLIIYAMRDAAPADTQKSASRKAMRRGRFDAAGRMFKTTLKARFLGFLASCIVDHAFALYDFIQDTRKSSGAICDGPHAGLTPLQKLSRRSNGQILYLVAYSVAGATGAVKATWATGGATGEALVRRVSVLSARWIARRLGRLDA